MTHRYDALPQTEQKFARYLVLEPGLDKAPLVGRIVTSVLDEFPSYHAVSYVWGELTKVDGLECRDGGEVLITANLSAVLRRVRHESDEIILWVDQVCINQNDLPERGSQVSIMGEIFAKAESTLICLGSWDVGVEKTDEIASLLNDVNLYVDEILTECDGDWYGLPQAMPGDPYYEDHRWFSYRALIRSRWFVRVWCIQEAGVSSNPRILYGGAEFKWEPIFRVSAYLRDAGFPIATRYGVSGHPTHLGRAWIWGNKQAGSFWNLSARMTLSQEGLPGLEWHLLELLHDSRSLFVTDERDYIYAFLGQRLLAKIMGAPDYRAEPGEIYRHFAVQWLRETGDLNLLAYVQRGHRRPRGTEDKSILCTWMPNWAYYGASVLSQFRDRKWKAGGIANGTGNFTIHENTNFLEVQAAVIDSIAFCSPIFTIYDFSLIEEDGDSSVLEKMSAAWPESLDEVFGTGSKCAYPTRSVPFAATMTVGGVGEDDYGKAMAAAYFSQHYKHMNASEAPDEMAHGQAAYEANSAPALWFESRAEMPSLGRRFIVTKAGYYGLVPAMADIGDNCCIIQGARAAYILRPVLGVDDHFEMIGEAYIHGAMMGEFAGDDVVLWDTSVLI